MPLAETTIEGFVGTISLDHFDKRNAFSAALADEVIQALERFIEACVRVAILRARPGVKAGRPAVISTSCRRAAATRSAGTTH